MHASTGHRNQTAKPKNYFATTHWSVVLTAGRNDTARAHDALEKLCQTYWFPLYAYIRRRGFNPHDAEDLTQGFFARLLKANSLADACQEKGRFRSFLLGAMNHFMADEWDRATAAKRSVQQTISLDALLAENRYRHELADMLTPDRVFERQWALTLLENALGCVRREYEASGQGRLFMELRFAITGDQTAVPYPKLVARLGMSEGTIRVAVHRLRKRYRQALRAEIAGTVADDAEVAAELVHLRQALSQ